ncbi:hypothetical protein B0T17DRAFT_148351 [Bombardia bombarda]|uniref:Uncharacterized protein n=1 Tax=Bombardia bombarda TaxID=252184 RepID=A0AA39X7Q0_9PEZI|nr:hypothetical protein B0T17DRAFT_148351 [Bombardia bombarda]
MSGEILQWQCTCSAFFPTNDALEAHLEEYKSRERYLSAEREKCRTHSRVDDDPATCDNGLDDSNNGPTSIHGGTTSSGQHLCPRNEYVSCEKVCVCCFKVLRLASEYIRHADKHKDAHGAELTYITAVCAELCEHVDQELDRSLAEHKKRAWDTADLDLVASEARRPRLDKTDGMNANHSRPQHINAGFADISVEAFYANSMEESSTYFDAPILSILNFPPASILLTDHPQWMPEDHSTKHPNVGNVYRE